MRISDWSSDVCSSDLIAAASGTRSGGNRTEFNKGVFSPCELCRDDPTRPPLWQLKANEVIHDQETHDVIYHDAWMEFFGIPVFYTPYLQHPDPTVDRRSGFRSEEHTSELQSLMRISYA